MVRATSHPDLIDNLLGLDPDGSTYQARHFRTKVLDGTQQSYEALFNPALSLPLSYRFLVAFYASRLSQADELKAHYLEQVKAQQVAPEIIYALEQDNLSALTSAGADTQLGTILQFTRKLILNPIEGDQAAIQAVEQTGLSVPDCVVLSQLVAFLSYQSRLVVGLKAMQALEQNNE